MKFSVGYQLCTDDALLQTIIRYRQSISEIYFAFSDLPNGRNLSVNSQCFTETGARRRQMEQLTFLHAHGFSFQLLLNGNCYGRHALSRAFFCKIGDLIEDLSAELSLTGVTTTSPLIAKFIKQKAKELGATVCGIGGLDLFADEMPQRDPKMILPHAKCIIGFGFAVPKGLYMTMDIKSQFYTYTTMGVKYIDEEMAEIFLLKIGGLIEDEGYDACLQKAIPNLRIKGDPTTNPEVADTYELIHAVPVEPGKPCPDVIIDFGKAAKACGIGETGLSGKIINREYGPFMRYCFIITDAPLALDPPLSQPVCDGCGECAKACPGNAIGQNGRDTWQCAVYYKGAHRSNPFMTDDFLKDHPEREEILNGTKRFNRESAREIFPKMDFLPRTQWGYAPCLCGKKCDVACYRHLKGGNAL